MHIPTFVFIFILFRINILFLLLYPKHVRKQLGSNLGCYIANDFRYSPTFLHSISSSDGWPDREDHSDVRGYAESLCDGIQGELGYSFGTYGVRLQQ